MDRRRNWVHDRCERQVYVVVQTHLEPQVFLSGQVTMSVERMHWLHVHQQRFGSVTEEGLVGHPPTSVGEKPGME
jgi:hypothetical protein